MAITVTFSAKVRTVLAWMTTTCSSLVRFCIQGGILMRSAGGAFRGWGVTGLGGWVMGAQWG